MSSAKVLAVLTKTGGAVSALNAAGEISPGTLSFYCGFSSGKAAF